MLKQFVNEVLNFGFSSDHCYTDILLNFLRAECSVSLNSTMGMNTLISPERALCAPIMVHSLFGGLSESMNNSDSESHLMSAVLVKAWEVIRAMQVQDRFISYATAAGILCCCF